MAASLLFRILGDSSPITRTLQTIGTNANKMGDKFGQDFGRGIKSRLMGMIGVGAIFGGIKGISAEAGEQAQRARQLGITAEALQTLNVIAKETGQSVEELLKKFPKMTPAAIAQIDALREALLKAGVIATDQAVAAAARLDAQWTQLVNKFKTGILGLIGFGDEENMSKLINRSRAALRDMGPGFRSFVPPPTGGGASGSWGPGGAVPQSGDPNALLRQAVATLKSIDTSLK
jgi:hypothetical protein